MKISEIESIIKKFKQKIDQNPSYYEEHRNERAERKHFYQSYTKERILEMTEEDFFEYISRLWAMLIWGNKQYVVEKLIDDNSFENIKENLVDLLYGEESLEIRWDSFKENIKGLGPATISELLTYVHPQECIIFNKNTIKGFTYLEVPDLPKYNYQYTGEKYKEVCNIARRILEKMINAGIEDVDLLFVDYFIWDELIPLAKASSNVESTPVLPDVDKIGEKESKSLHDEIKDKIVIIGELLGFDSKPEVKIAKGAIVDAVWEAKIGNMGKAIYVFEVQTKGSIDSLILNLKKAFKNPAVQAVVAVSDEKQLQMIKDECEGVYRRKITENLEFGRSN